MKKNSAMNEFAEPARHLVEDLRQLLAVTVHVTAKKTAAAGQYLTATMGKSGHFWHDIWKRTVSVAKATDRLIQGHPYPSLGIALGLGLLLGFLAHGRE